MAERQFKYSELKEIIESNIEKSPDRERLTLYETAILFSLSQKVNNENEGDPRETMALWGNVNKSESPFGEHYIQIQDTVINLYTKFIEKGVFYDIVISQSPSSIKNVPVTTDYFIRLCTKLTNSILALDGSDICLANKAIEHFDNLTNTNIGEINNWFPSNTRSGNSSKCNMLHSQMHFSCNYYNFETGLCSISSNSSNLINALDSLTKKKILTQNSFNQTYSINGRQS